MTLIYSAIDKKWAGTKALHSQAQCQKDRVGADRQQLEQTMTIKVSFRKCLWKSSNHNRANPTPHSPSQLHL